MATAVRAQDASLRRRWQRFSWVHPELWVLVLSATAWVVLSWPGSPASHAAAAHHSDHDAVAPLAMLARETSAWLLMVGAMMLPVVAGPVKFTAAHSLRQRRQRGMTWFVGGYVMLWLMAGFLLAMTVTAVHFDAWPQPAAGVSALVLAAAWQMVPLRRRLSMSCHRTMPLSPAGWAADRDCLRYGWLIGERCLLVCLPLMLACVATRHNLIVLAILTVLSVTERYSDRPDVRLLTLTPLLAAAAVIASTTLAG